MLKARAYSELLRVAKETAWEWSWKSHSSSAAEMFRAAKTRRAVIGRGSSWPSPWRVVWSLSAKNEGLCSFSVFLVYLSFVCLLLSSHQMHEAAIDYTDLL